MSNISLKNLYFPINQNQKKIYFTPKNLSSQTDNFYRIVSKMKYIKGGRRMKKRFLRLAPVALLLFLSTGCNFWDTWMGEDEKKDEPKTVNQSNLKTSQHDSLNTITVDQKKLPDVLRKTHQANQKLQSLSYSIRGTQKLTNQQALINHNEISLQGDEVRKDDIVHLTGKINNDKDYELWKSKNVIFEKVTSKWSKRNVSEAKRSPYDTISILDFTLDALSNPDHTTGLTLKEEQGNYIITASKKYLDQSTSIKKQMTDYLQEGVTTALNESNSTLKLDRVHIKDFSLTYEINQNDYQYYKVKLNLSYDYTLNGKTFGVEEKLEKLNKGTFNGSLKIPDHVMKAVEQTQKTEEPPPTTEIQTT